MGFRTKAAGVLALALTVSVGTAYAQSGPGKERNVLMRSMLQDAFVPLRTMAQGKAPFDKAAVDSSFALMLSITDKVAPMWPPNSPSDPAGRFGSSPKVWENKADFDAKLVSFKSVVQSTQGLAAGGLDGLKDAFQKIDDSCNACHEPYRIRLR